MKTKSVTVIILSLLAALNFTIWGYINNPLNIQSWNKSMQGLTFNPARKDQNPAKGDSPTEAQIIEDLELLSDKVFAIRTYTVGGGFDKIPELAAQYGINVSVGAWIGRDLKSNQDEINKLLKIVRANPRNVVRTIVGNESLLRRDISVEQLIEYIRQVRKYNWRPISTSETWDIWIANPELVAEVDFIGVHILPFWEGVSSEKAVDYIFERYHQLQKTYPDKPIVITEVGWPSNGQPFKGATASLANQAKFIRQFLNRASQEKVTYYVVEAFDQPWKKSIEGSAGAYWGMFNADRKAKFPMDGEVFPFPKWRTWATGAVVLSIILITFFLFTRPSLKIGGKLFFGIIANLSASMLLWTASIGVQQYQTTVSIVFWVILLLMQALAALILLIESLEIAEVVWHKPTARTFKPLTPSPEFRYPKVSLHLPIHNEPPLMVRKTLEALAKVDYPNLEVLVMDNNTKDPEIWQPVEKDCERLGERFRFFHLENWPGFKAGAINHALEQTAEDAEIIAVIDSDYILSPDWLKAMVPYFDNPQVGFVQSPQDYRDLHISAFKSCCYWEYAGFFNIGMVQRNEYNAIIQHGTMTMIRKSALLEVGRWAEWCICEDSELGLRLYEAGYDSVYVKDSFGKGLMPDTMSGYMTQRYRWVYGAMQIIKAHWKSFLPSRKPMLTSAQRYYFLAGWLPWFSDALALLFVCTSLALTGLIALDPLHSELPINAFMLPTIGLFSFKILRSLWLYQVRVPCSIWQSLGASLAGLSLTHTVAKGVLQGIFIKGKPFMRTPKYEKQRPLLAGLVTIWQELILLILLGVAIWFMYQEEHFDNTNGRLWMAVLAVQSVPYLASFFTLLISVAQHYFGAKNVDNNDNLVTDTPSNTLKNES